MWVGPHQTGPLPPWSSLKPERGHPKDLSPEVHSAGARPRRGGLGRVRQGH